MEREEKSFSPRRRRTTRPSGDDMNADLMERFIDALDRQTDVLEKINTSLEPIGFVMLYVKRYTPLVITLIIGAMVGAGFLSGDAGKAILHSLGIGA